MAIIFCTPVPPPTCGPRFQSFRQLFADRESAPLQMAQFEALARPTATPSHRLGHSPRCSSRKVYPTLSQNVHLISWASNLFKAATLRLRPRPFAVPVHCHAPDMAHHRFGWPIPTKQPISARELSTKNFTNQTDTERCKDETVRCD